MLPGDLIEDHFRLTAPQKAALKRLKLTTIENLVRHFPSRYESITETGRTDSLVPGSKVTLFGVLTKLEAKKLWKSRRSATEGVFEDQSGKVKVLWFNQPYIANMVPQNQFLKLSGSVAGSAERPYITNPETEVLGGSAIPEGLFDETTTEAPELFPVYPETKGITSRWFYHALKKVFTSGVLEEIEDVVPEHVRKTYNLPALSSALVWVHAPEKKSHADAARKRFAFEEIFLIQVAKHMERKENDSTQSFQIPTQEERVKRFIEALPFSLTQAQLRAIDEIQKDLARNTPMARLLEGDVGSGKTIVAAATAYSVVTARPPGRSAGTLQVAYMAPTEILAAQHFESFVELFKHLPINIGLLTGSGCYKFPSKVDKDTPTKISRAQLLKWVESGEIAMLVGTHALIQKSVKFQNLAYVIVDEQHRFGTRQRRALAHKGERMPHFLSMTATPIPRTLALTMYGDLDLSILDELPKGRMQVETKIVTKQGRKKMYEHMRKELESGRQAYVICPRIDEPDPEKAQALRLKSVKEETKRLKKEEFQSYTLEMLHSKMKPDEKDAVMEAFNERKSDILVATSVVEVGINVPNATVILIEGAERFGLAQLHQLRGRVQRSSHQPYCYLLPEKMGDRAKDRLGALAKTANGFELAEEDLKQRGAGDLFGSKQWGITDLGMEALQNPRLIEAARNEAQSIISKDSTLKDAPSLKEKARRILEELHEE